MSSYQEKEEETHDYICEVNYPICNHGYDKFVVAFLFVIFIITFFNAITHYW